MGCNQEVLIFFNIKTYQDGDQFPRRGAETNTEMSYILNSADMKIVQQCSTELHQIFLLSTQIHLKKHWSKCWCQRSLHAFFSDLQMPENEVTIFLWNARNQLPSDMAAYPRQTPLPLCSRLPCLQQETLAQFIRVALHMGRNIQNAKHQSIMYLHFFGTADIVGDLPHLQHTYLGRSDLKIWLLWIISKSSTRQAIIKCARMWNEAHDCTNVDLCNNSLLVIQLTHPCYNHAATLTPAFCSQNKFHSCIVSCHTVSIHTLYNQEFTFIIQPSSISLYIYEIRLALVLWHVLHPLTCPKQDLWNVNKLFFYSILALTLRRWLEQGECMTNRLHVNSYFAGVDACIAVSYSVENGKNSIHYSAVHLAC
jgi:hypothetical protein